MSVKRLNWWMLAAWALVFALTTLLVSGSFVFGWMAMHAPSPGAAVAPATLALYAASGIPGDVYWLISRWPMVYE